MSPYPHELEQTVVLKDGSDCLFRPILPEDEPLLKLFIDQVTKEDLYYRYFSEINEFSHDDLANMTQIDYDREMAFVAVRQTVEGPETLMIGKVLWQEFFNNRDWPVASALAVVMLAILIVPIILFNRSQAKEMEGKI